MNEAPAGFTTPDSPGPPASESSRESTPGPPRPPPVIPDHELLQLIGHGAYGGVWMARSVMGTLRAVKVVYREDFGDPQPFDREFKGIQKFEPVSRAHEGLIDILQVGRGDGHFYYVMELADAQGSQNEEGRSEKAESADSVAVASACCPLPSSLSQYSPRTLRHELRVRGRLPFDECLQIGLALASALEHLHEHGLVHRDVKPSNIVFVNGQPKLADIGLVAGVDEARSFVGTVGFIPPEGPGKPQADLYSLGIVLYVMCTGNRHDAFPEPRSDLVTDPDQACWLELNAIIHKACHTDPRQRYATATELKADLELLQRGGSVRNERTRQRCWVIARTTVVLAALLALVVVGVQQAGRRRARWPWAFRRERAWRRRRAR